MGFWDWFLGKSRLPPTVDTIWMNGRARLLGLRRAIEAPLVAGDPVFSFAHFPESLATLEADLAAAGIPHETHRGELSFAQAERLLARRDERVVRLALVRQLAVEPPGGLPPEPTAGTAHLFTAERHFLRPLDDRVPAFAAGLSCPSRIEFHLALDDPLLKNFVGPSLMSLLKSLGMREDEAIESAMVARSILKAQRKFTSRSGRSDDARSAEDWLRENA